MAQTKEAPPVADDPTASAPTVPGTDAPQASADTTTANKRPRPTYAAEKVSGELPVDLKLTRSGPRTDPAFIEALQVAQSDPGEFYRVATFQSANGARTALKAIQKSERKVPAGEWDFEARRIEAPNGDTDGNGQPVRWSVLFAKYLG